MEKRVIWRGLLAGAIGGVVAYLFARAFVDPAIGRAIDFEAAQSAPGHEEGAELFTRAVQANVGMGFGVVAFGMAMGALFAVAFVVAWSRLGDIGPRGLSILLAAGAFGAIVFVPWLKYPPNPPAVGHEETLGDRTGLYLLRKAQRHMESGEIPKALWHAEKHPRPARKSSRPTEVTSTLATA